MVQIPIISGIGAEGADFVSSYPVNLVPVPKVTGISEGYLRPAEGIVQVATGPGVNRGGYRWRDQHYRVMGARLLRIEANNSVVDIGAIAGANWCTFAESFDYLAINGGGALYLFNGTTLAQVTDVDLGTSLDVEWCNGYFISTDGANLVTTTLADPFQVVNRYASSEINPDPVVGLQKLRNEIYAINRYTIEVFSAVQNPGLDFPFARIEGAQIMKGAVGGRAVCELSTALAFLGGGTNEPPAIWLGSNGQTVKLSTRDIDGRLRSYSDGALAGAVLESRVDRGHEFLYVHLPLETLVYDVNASASVQMPVWFSLVSGSGVGYRARGLVWAYSRWNVADPFGAAIGFLSDKVGSQYGNPVGWEFQTPIIYNDGRGALVHELELVALSGNVALGADPMIYTDYSVDGLSWSQAKAIRAGRLGERVKRLVWRRQGMVEHWRVQRFRGDSSAHLAFARLEAQLEPLA